MILVAGASGGVGTALCLALAARGEDLALTARDRERLEALAEQVRAAGGTATVHPCDLRDQEAVAELAAEVLTLHGAPSAVVSLAGHSLRRSLADTIGRPHDLVRLTSTNMLGPAALLLALLAPMSRAGGGRFLAATSASARIPTPGWAAYGASKAGLDAWLRAIRPEAEQAGVRITVVELPLVATAMAAPTYGDRPRGALTPAQAAARVLRALDRAPTLISPLWARLAAVFSQAAPALAARGAGAGAEIARRLAARGSAGPARPGRRHRPARAGRGEAPRRGARGPTRHPHRRRAAGPRTSAPQRHRHGGPCRPRRPAGRGPAAPGARGGARRPRRAGAALERLHRCPPAAAARSPLPRAAALPGGSRPSDRAAAGPGHGLRRAGGAWPRTGRDAGHPRPRRPAR